MLHMLWFWLQLLVLGQDDVDHGSIADSGHDIDPNG